MSICLCNAPWFIHCLSHAWWFVACSWVCTCCWEHIDWLMIVGWLTRTHFPGCQIPGRLTYLENDKYLGSSILVLWEAAKYLIAVVSTKDMSKIKYFGSMFLHVDSTPYLVVYLQFPTVAWLLFDNAASPVQQPATSSRTKEPDHNISPSPPIPPHLMPDCISAVLDGSPPLIDFMVSSRLSGL